MNKAAVIDLCRETGIMTTYVIDNNKKMHCKTLLDLKMLSNNKSTKVNC